MPEKQAKKKVYVGMSGGVDSSVSALLLKRAGYDVTGVFIEVWTPDWMECTSREDRLDAMRVAAQIDIPLVTIDLSEEYKKEVVDYMISEYKTGQTPNPDVMCNTYVKFGAFYRWALAHGADFVATGHYAISEDGRLLSGVDESKDQSYFLWSLRSSELRHIVFPVGGFKKAETRRLAKKFNLPNADKKDSQGLCFIGKVDIKEFLGHYIQKKPGAVLSVLGKTIGDHDGAFFYTLGERHGFRITEKTPHDNPLYIIEKNIDENTLTVSHKKPDGALSVEKKEFRIHKTNWVGDIPKTEESYSARIRHLGEKLPCKVLVERDLTKVIFDTPTLVAPGQSIVIYDKAVCLGGGIVKE